MGTPLENNTLALQDILSAIHAGAGGGGEAMTFETIWEICGYAPGGLPDGYIRLEYIEGDGSQFIDTGFIPNQDTRVVISAYNQSTSSSWVYGVWHAVDNTQFGGNVKKTYNIRYGSGNAQLVDLPVGAFEIDHNKNAYNFNGTTGTISAQTFSCSYPMYLFALNAAGSASSGRFIGRIYSCQIYDNGTLVRNFVPCINPDGVYGLFDRENCKFYGSGGGLITESNISTYFTVTNSSYYFKGNGSVFTTNNKGVNSSTAQTTLTAKQDMDISFTYSYSSESNYDKFTLTFAGVTVENGKSGATTTKTHSGHLTAGQTIVFKYVKDSSSASGDDQCTFSNMIVPTVFTGA